MGNFDINANFNIANTFNKFNNSIDDFNKRLSQLPEFKGIDGNINFDDILKKVSQKQDEEIKTQSTSPVAKMAADISTGFKNSIQELNDTQRKAEHDFETFASGGDISIHEVMISAEKSSLAMQMAIQLRNQMINAYNEFKNMSI